MSQNNFLHSRPRSGLGTQTGVWGRKPSILNSRILAQHKGNAAFYTRGLHPRAPRLGSQPRQSRRGGNGG